MNPFLRLCTSWGGAFAGVVLWAGLFAPVALALPGAGLAKNLSVSQLVDKPVVADKSNLEGLVKKVGWRLGISYGGYGYPGGLFHYGHHRHYYPGSYGYGRYSYGVPVYRYRSYRRPRAYRRYKARRHYRKRRYSRRHLRRHRHSRRHRHLRRIRRQLRRWRY